MYKNILLYDSGGGLGDAIRIFPLIISLKKHFIKSKFYYLGAHENHFNHKLKEFNIYLDTVDLDLKYFGFRWWHLIRVKQKIKDKNIAKFDLIIDLQSKIRNTIILKQLPYESFFSSTFNYFFCTKKNKYFSNENEFITNILSNLDIFLDTKITKIDFDLNTLPEHLIKESTRLLPEKNYIGFSITQGNKYRLKTWKVENFIELANKCILMGKKIVFFIEKSEVELIYKVKKKLPFALFPEEQSKFSCPALVTALATRLEKSISIDNGTMHMINLAKIPMIILFGPTDSKKFAPKRLDVQILDSKEMYKSKDINKITVADVINFL